jgi:hypothetical protein
MNNESGVGPVPGFGRIEASIFGESALIDRETGRVYWECGGITNTLYESFAPKLDQFGAEHAQATLLTLVITLAFLSVLSGWLQKGINSYYYNNGPSLTSQTLSVLIILAEWTILKIPKIENKWLVLISLILYFLESYNCSTRCYLANAVSSSTELDTYIDGLRREQPIVSWKVKTFHYELRRLFAVTRIIRLLARSLKKAGNTPKDEEGESSSSSSSSSSSLSSFSSQTPLQFALPKKPASRQASIFTRKVITNEVSETYQYASCDDSTIAGIWTRAQDSDDGAVPFTKIALSKLLVLADRRSREDYFQQQSNFVTKYGREDEFAEFSTNIEVTGYRPRLLLTRSLSHQQINTYTKLFRLSVFWIFTFLGLTVPYRIWFKRHCDFIRVTVVKETKATGVADSYLRSWFPSHATIQPKFLSKK